MATKHVIGFSGGIDSQACVTYVLHRFPKDDIIVMNSQAGRNEHPITVDHVKWFSENVHPVVDCIPLVKDLGGRGTRPGRTKDVRDSFGDDAEMTFDVLAKIKGIFPSKKKQFCTEHLKLNPQLRWMKENVFDKGHDAIRYAGVRRDESKGRESVPFAEFDSMFDCELQRPIADWSKSMCFDYVKMYGQKVNPLYEMGFSRVGCAPCVNSNKDDILQWATRAPEMIDKVRKWEKEVGKAFFMPMVPGKTINWIDEVVAWSKTAYGGKKIMLPFAQADADAATCVSKYGLCG